MSRSQPTLVNPCSKWIEYSGDSGEFFTYNKETKAKEKVEMPIYFAVLDELSAISGYSEKYGAGVYSNEVSSVVHEQLRVKTFKGGCSIIGMYKDIRDNIAAIGGKFTKSVYALLIHEDRSTEFVNFRFKGSAFSAWLDKGFNPMNFIVGVAETVEETKGKTRYQVPVFKSYRSDPDIDAAAVEQDKVLQEYLKVYKAQAPEAEIAKAEAANPLIDEDKGFVANDIYRGAPKTQQELINNVKESKMTRGGKVEVQSMTDPAELGNHEEFEPDNNNELSDLPFILTIPIALGFVMQFIV